MDNIYLSKNFERVCCDEGVTYIIANDIDMLINSFDSVHETTEGIESKGFYEWDCLHMMWSKVLPEETVYSKLSEIYKDARLNAHEITIKVRYDGKNIIPVYPEPPKPEKLSKQLRDYLNREREDLTSFTYASIVNLINFLEETGE